MLSLLSLALLCDVQVLTWNQDQDTQIPNSLISNLFLFSSGQLSKTWKEITKKKGYMHNYIITKQANWIYTE